VPFLAGDCVFHNLIWRPLADKKTVEFVLPRHLHHTQQHEEFRTESPSIVLQSVKHQEQQLNSNLFLNCLNLQMTALCPFDTLLTIYQLTWSTHLRRLGSSAAQLWEPQVLQHDDDDDGDNDNYDDTRKKRTKEKEGVICWKWERILFRRDTKQLQNCSKEYIPHCRQKKGWKYCEAALCGHYIKPSVTTVV